MSEIATMSVETRLLKLEEIWNSFDDVVLKSPKWHEDVLTKRQQKYQNKMMQFISLDELEKKRSEI